MMIFCKYGEEKYILTFTDKDKLLKEAQFSRQNVCEDVKTTGAPIG